jgi:hypothetical protein
MPPLKISAFPHASADHPVAQNEDHDQVGCRAGAALSAKPDVADALTL